MSVDREGAPHTSILLYQTEEGRTRLECRFEYEAIWLSQRQIAAHYDIGVNTVNHHLKEILEEGEVDPGPTIRSYRIVQDEKGRQVSRIMEHYSLPIILVTGARLLGGCALTGCQPTQCV